MEWLDKLKEGDKVIYAFGHHPLMKQVLHIDRLTKTMIVCGNFRFNRKTGLTSGGNAWCTTKILEWTQESEDHLTRELIRHNRTKDLSRFNYRNLDDDKLNLVYELVFSEEGES